jgi:hypothetical protein
MKKLLHLFQVTLISFTCLIVITGYVKANENALNNPGMVEYDLGNGSDHDLNLQELLESLAPTVVSAKDKYFVLPACEENKEETILVEVEVTKDGNKNPGYLYFFPKMNQHFILESHQAESAAGKLKLWNNSTNRVTISETQVSVQGANLRSLDVGDVVSCIGKTLGIDVGLNNLVNTVSSVSCSALKTMLTAQIALHCFSMAGIGVNNVTSTAGCVIGIARLVACGIANCSNLSAQLDNVNLSGGGHPNRTNGAFNFCTLSFPCLAGQGDCDINSQCQTGLVCNKNRGGSYGFSASTDVCEAPSNGGGNAPGSSCGDGKVYDCLMNCIDASTASNWTGDGYCDDGAYGIVLTCSAFNHDGGDCN